MEGNLTYEKILELFRLSDERFEKRLEEQRQKFDREYEKRREERDREYEKRQEELDRKEEERRKEFDRTQEERRKEFDREFKKSQKAFDKRFAEVTDTLGRFAENQVRPAAIRLFSNLGIPITDVGLNMTKSGADRQVIYEVDILLFNTLYVVAIEVKSTLRKEDIDEQLERLALMQQYPLKGIMGTKIIGAVAAMNANADVKRYAMKKGLYVIVPNGESVSIANTKDFQPQYWEIQ